MKIKTITCHDVYNAGASLQAYALQTYLSKLGHDVEIIDYKPEYLSRHYSLTAINPEYEKPIIKQIYLTLKLPGRLKRLFSVRKRNFDEFKSSYLRTTDTCYKSYEELKNNPPEADIYFAGSDQIWNPLFQNGKDPAFYLQFAPKNTIKASYAASFSVDEIPKDIEDTIKIYIDDLDYVSVRERSSVDMLKKMGIENCECVCDPVFLLDKQEWDKLTFNISDEKYILVYDFDNSDAIKNFSINLAKEKGLKIYSVFKNNYADKCFFNEGPLGFLSLIKNADFVVSNSFHASAFSIIYKKDFAVVERKENINVRMNSLLEDYNLKNRLIFSNQLMFKSINYDLIQKTFTEKQYKSINFMNKAIKGVNNA